MENAWLITIFIEGISFTPHEVGDHYVNVRKRDGRHVTNSPFKIKVGQSEIGDASKVRVYGEGVEKARACETAEFFVDTRQAGMNLEIAFNLIILIIYYLYLKSMNRDFSKLEI